MTNSSLATAKAAELSPARVPVVAPTPVRPAAPARAPLSTDALTRARQLSHARVFAVDRRPLLRSGLAGIARRAFGGGAHALSDLEQAAAALQFVDAPPRALLLGLRPGDDPGTLVRAARRVASPVICVFDGADPALIRAALAAEADGYMLIERATPDALCETVEAIESGQRVVPEELAGYEPGGRPALTARCLEVLRSLAAGMHDDEIADELGISTSSVRKHIAAAQERLAARTRTQVVAMLAGHGLL